MNIKRITEAASAGKDTHKHKSLKQAFRFAREAFQNDPNHVVLDLFARTCPWGDFRNDLNPDFKKQGYTNMSMDALEAAKPFENNSIDIIINLVVSMVFIRYQKEGRLIKWIMKQ